jgi:hypothetical protein
MSSVKLSVNSIRAEHAGKTPRRPPVPEPIKALVAAQAAKHPTDLEDRGSVGVSYIEKLSLKSVSAYAADLKDAGNAIAVFKNASFFQAEFSYHAAQPRQIVLTDKPKDGKLQMQVVITPSWHASRYSEPKAPKDDAPQAEWDAYEAAYEKYDSSCTENATKFALTNSYHVTVTYADGTVDQKSFKVNGKDPEWSSASPEIEVDLNRAKGDIVVRGWADGSAGADAYMAARVSVIKNS